MPYVFVGKRNFYIGKTLWEILGNLKNFGIGRILVRSKFERYPEVSYVKILRVEPLMDEENKFGRVWVEKVFRGRSYGEYELSHTTYKNDFKLVPKDEEELYFAKTLTSQQVDALRKPLPEYLQFPPLLKEMIRRTENIDKPLLKAVYKLGPENLVKVVPGLVLKNMSQIEGTPAPRLYENLKRV